MQKGRGGMSTWHQNQAPAVLWHSTLFTLVFDPLSGHMCVERFATLGLALAAQGKRPHTYILSPRAL